MSKKVHPLDIAFGMEEAGVVTGDFLATPAIPTEERNLDKIIELSLAAYEEQMTDIAHMEAKHRAAYLAVAEKFLQTAKDAMYKKEQIKLQREKMLLSSKNQQKKSPEQAASDTGNDEQDDEPVLSREELLRMRVV